MGAFEDFVNANLGIRKPLITDAGPPSQSSKAAGIPGSHYIDSNNNFLVNNAYNNGTELKKPLGLRIVEKLYLLHRR